MAFGDVRRGKIAEVILRVREQRYQHFSSAIFDEHAWTMMLHIFCASVANMTVSESELLRRTAIAGEVGRRWLQYLAADGHIESRLEGGDVSLTLEAVERLRAYLDESADIARSVLLAAGQEGTSST